MCLYLGLTQVLPHNDSKTMVPPVVLIACHDTDQKQWRSVVDTPVHTFSAVQVGLLGQQINAAMIAKQDQLAAAITQLKDTLHNEVEERLQGSLDLLKSTVTSSADALKAHFESELLSLRSTVSQLEGRAGRAGAEPSSAAQSKAWAADMDTLVNHVSTC